MCGRLRKKYTSAWRQEQTYCFRNGGHRRLKEVSFKFQIIRRRNQLGKDSGEAFQAEELEMGMSMVCSKEKIRSSAER